MNVGLGLRGMGSNVLLVLDVLLNDGQWCVTYRGDKIAIGPKRWQATLEERKVLSQFARTQPLDLLDETVNSVLWIHINKQMHMIWHHFQLDKISVPCDAHTLHNTFERLISAIHKNRAAVLRAPHNVVLA